MPDNDREVFDHVTAQVGENKQERQIAFLTYALFAFEKREWIKLFKSRNDDGEPSQADIDTWISNVTESQFTTWRNEAERFFVDAADAYFQEQLETERLGILRSAIVSEVKAASSLWRQVGIALLTAILAPLIIGGILVAAAAYDRGMFSATSVFDRAKTKSPSSGLPPAASSTR